MQKKDLAAPLAPVRGDATPRPDWTPRSSSGRCSSRSASSACRHSDRIKGEAGNEGSRQSGAGQSRRVVQRHTSDKRWGGLRHRMTAAQCSNLRMWTGFMVKVTLVRAESTEGGDGTQQPWSQGQ